MLFQPTLCAALGLAALIVQGGEARPETTVPHATGSLDDFLAAQSPIAFQGILNNIGPSGAYSEGVNPGVVIASPSKQDPDCMPALEIFQFCWQDSLSNMAHRLLHLGARRCSHCPISGGGAGCRKCQSSVPHSGLHQLPGTTADGGKSIRLPLVRWSRRAQVSCRRDRLYGLLGPTTAGRPASPRHCHDFVCQLPDCKSDFPSCE